MKSLYEELGGTYRQVGDYFIPDIELPERNYEIGKYGRMRHRYLKEHRKIQYTTMILDGTLYDHLEEIDRICNERIETMVATMKSFPGCGVGGYTLGECVPRMLRAQHVAGVGGQSYLFATDGFNACVLGGCGCGCFLCHDSLFFICETLFTLPPFSALGFTR